MKRVFIGFVIGLLLLALVSACSLTDILSNASEGDGTAGGSDDSGSADGGGQPVASIDMNQLSGSNSPGLVRKDKKKYNSDDFAARTIPVEVTLSGPITPQVRYDGALAEPNYEVQDGSSMNLRIYLVFYLPGESVLTQGPDSIYFSSYKMKWTVELFNTGGSLLQTSEINVNSALQPAYLHAFDAYMNAIPAAATSAKVAVKFEEELRMGASCIEPSPDLFCATASDTVKPAPDAILQVSPVQMRIEKDNWNETYAKDSALGNITFQYRNPYKIGLSPIITLLFTDNSGELVGYHRIDDYIEPGQLRGRTDPDYYQTSYFSAIPTGVQVYTWVSVSDLITALR